jgi:hypothetical protein
LLRFRQQALNTGIITGYFENDPTRVGLNYNVKLAYAVLGYNWNDLEIAANFKLLFNAKIGGIKANFQFKRLTPDWTHQFYFSNHYKWDNSDFAKINVLHFGGTYFNPNWQFQASYQNYLLGNYIVWNESGLPEQVAQAINISQITAQHRFNWRWLHMNNQIVLQVSSSNKVPLPNYYGQHKLYFEDHIFRNKSMLLQFGFDMQTMSNYYANAYNPATGQFQLQNAFTVPADPSINSAYLFYPAIDFFVGMKVKKVRAFLKLQHLNHNILPQKSYFASPYHPMPDLGFRMGLWWMFYD